MHHDFEDFEYLFSDKILNKINITNEHLHKSFIEII